jgi:hypothetical protein
MGGKFAPEYAIALSQLGNLEYLQRIKVFSGPKKVVISSKKYDIHRLTLTLYILNVSPPGEITNFID